VQQIDDVGIRPATFDRLAPCDIAAIRHIEVEIAAGDDDGAPVFADERLRDIEPLLDEFELGSRLPGTEHQRHVVEGELLEQGRRRGEGCCVRRSQDAVHVGEHDHRRAGLCDGHQFTIPVGRDRRHPVDTVFLAMEAWRPAAVSSNRLAR